MAGVLEQVDLREAGAVRGALEAGARACRAMAVRRGCCEIVNVGPAHAGTPAGTLIATGDLHDNPLHLARVARAAGLDAAWETAEAGGKQPPHFPDDAAGPAHLILHELIHGDRLINGLDYSYRVLTRAAALKAAFPTRVHVLMANHEMAQLTGSPVAKEGVRCNEAFDEALDAAFGDGAGSVRAAVHAFIGALPLAVRFVRSARPGEDVLCAHSVPGPDRIAAFDPGVLDRELTPEDFKARVGAAHQMVWGRGHEPDGLRSLAERWGVSLFILGHEKAEDGWLIVEPNAVVLNSDHERGVYAPLDLTARLTPESVARACVRLADA
jgi:hypothetical protein